MEIEECVMNRIKFDAHLYGPIFSNSGVGAATRAYWKLLVATGLNVGIWPQSSPFNSQEAVIRDDFSEFLVDAAHPELNFFRINAEEILSVSNKLESPRISKSKKILIPFWETERLPNAWIPDVLHFDAIVSPSDFIKNSFNSFSHEIPNIKITAPIDIDRTRYYSVRDFGLPDDRRLVTSSFAYSSFIERKNPEAFVSLFLLMQDLNLLNEITFVLTAADTPKNPADIAFEEKLIKLQSRKFKYLKAGRDRDQQLSLFGASNLFISTHRSEGLGLQLAEAALLGTPIVTNIYSGPRDFVQEDYSGVYPHQLTPIQKGEYPHASGQNWAKFENSDVLKAVTYGLELKSSPPALLHKINENFSITRNSKKLKAFISSL
jgi:glycosyltransferase involved in cell wall biosynthesis